MTGLPEPVVVTRVIVDNDWAGDPDGLVGLAHHIRSRGNRVDAVTSSFLNPAVVAAPPTVDDAVDLAQELIAIMGADVPVYAGPNRPLDRTAAPSPAALAIVDHCRRDDPLPLFVVCAGPLTNIAEALISAPDIIDRFTLVWVGGSLTPGRFEYNRDTDPEAAEFVLGHARLRLHQFPVEAYEQCGFSSREFGQLLDRSGPVGEFLLRQYQSLPAFVRPGEVWILGDSPPVLITSLVSPWVGPVTDGRTVHTTVDTRLLFGDMVAALTE